MDQTNTVFGAIRRRSSGIWRVFGAVVAAWEGALIILVSVACGTAYHVVQYDDPGSLATHAAVGAGLCITFVTVCALKGHYRLPAYMPPVRQVIWPITTWTVSVLYAVALGFLFKAGSEISRGAAVTLALAGILAVVLSRRAVARLVDSAAASARIAARRILIVGSNTAIDTFTRQYQPWKLGLQIVGTCPLDFDDLPTALDRAAELGRTLQPDDIFILLPWSDTATIDRILDRVITLPAAVHLGPDRILDRFREVEIHRISTMATVCLVQAPLTPFERALKRTLDVVGASAALVMLAPVLLLIAVAIKLDSKGPIIFRQLRYGFNQKPFAVLKFRTMVVHDAGDEVRQATRDDPRVTRVGAVLRRWNLDELPQLVNVLRNEMSLVGPRPHAVPHNLDFERRIALYARRHNVKPGLTGWAQVNGFRGPTDSEEQLRERVQHDLEYVENWSLGGDLAILARTVISRKAYQNAH